MNTTKCAGSALVGLALMGALVLPVAAQTEQTTVSEEAAMEIALAEVPGTVQEVELESEDGLQVYEVEILSADGQEFEVEIAADTGAVLEVEAEDEEDDDDEDDDA